ncbi:glutathione S-transferase family protein [Anaeromyxobacter paludicola]|uniref:Glutathione S-transferase n=1 Tax=Anaeromyxobacter paludicola TaxID=2918171 RepID=A0ABN6NB41_9BACT|nr:glutathione S-transferase family protein [Anaeromyxobacter paludicola]BDG09580.1 glutathione S-transferase [Anaeromyxobacter paludicola]
MKIVLGNKAYSSWSLRPWLVLRHFGIACEEQVIPLDQPTSEADLRRASPSGRVPALLDGELTVWDSLAICEYLADKFTGKPLWPADPAARAVARSVSAEMHSGFTALRNHLPFKIKETFDPAPLLPEVQADVDRIVALWNDCRRRFGKGGPFLFGPFSIADAMYAPVVSRFRTYGVKPQGEAAAYAEAVWALPELQAWLEEARKETWRMKRYEQKA